MRTSTGNGAALAARALGIIEPGFDERRFPRPNENELLDDVERLQRRVAHFQGRGGRRDVRYVRRRLGHRPAALTFFAGRPPLRPFSREAVDFAALRADPPRLPISLIQRLFPKTPTISPRM